MYTHTMFHSNFTYANLNKFTEKRRMDVHVVWLPSIELTLLIYPHDHD